MVDEEDFTAMEGWVQGPCKGYIDQICGVGLLVVVGYHATFGPVVDIQCHSLFSDMATMSAGNVTRR